MAAKKMKVKEIKKNIKITEIPKEQPREEPLEDIIFMDSDAPETVFSSSSQTNPSLAQHLDDIPSAAPSQAPPQDNRPITRGGAAAPTEAERNASTAVNYALSQPASQRRSYDSSIRAGEIAAAATNAASRINPTLSESNERQAFTQTNRSSMDLRDRNARGGEPALRKFKEDKEYSPKTAEAYTERRRTEMM